MLVLKVLKNHFCTLIPQKLQALQKNLTEIKKRLPSEDILSYAFETVDKTACAIVYADGIVNKQLLGDLIARPLSKLNLQEINPQKNKNDGSRYALKRKIETRRLAIIFKNTGISLRTKAGRSTITRAARKLFPLF